jgi:phage shock protein A
LGSSKALVAIDGSKFKAVNNRDNNFTPRKLEARKQQLETSVGRYLAELDRADRDPALVPEERVEQLKEKIAKVRAQMKMLDAIDEQLAASPDEQVSFDRSGCSLDGHERAWYRHRRLQRTSVG